MDPWTVSALVATIAAVIALVIGARATRVVDRTRTAAGVASSVDLPAAVEGLRDRIDDQERRMAEERRDHDALVDNLGQGVLLLDERLRITQANAAAHALLASPPGSLIGRTVMEGFLDTQVDSITRAGMESGASVGEVRLSSPDGPSLIVRARRSSAGGLWLVLDDVSELRRLQQIRAEFIDNLSHELRTPLTTVSLLAETLTREADAAGRTIPAKMRDRIGKIEVETGHLVQMVNELLDLSRIESGGVLGVMDLLDMAALAGASIERLRLFADRQGVTIRLAVDGAIPPVRGDGDRLGQVLVNLLHNAVKFSPDGGDVTVGVGVEGATVVTSVADHGVGIPKTAQPRVFERFYKVDRARVRGEAGGTGLGLAIARHVIEQHGGRIWVVSEEGVGSTFSFALPLSVDTD